MSAHNKYSDTPSIPIRKATWLPVAGEPDPDFAKCSSREVMPKASPPNPQPGSPIEMASPAVHRDTERVRREFGTVASDSVYFARSGHCVDALSPRSDKGKPKQDSEDTGKSATTITEFEIDKEAAPSSVKPQKRSEVESIVLAALHRKSSSHPPAATPPTGKRTAEQKVDSRGRSAGRRATPPKGGATRGAAIVLCSLIAAAAYLLLSHGFPFS